MSLAFNRVIKKMIVHRRLYPLYHWLYRVAIHGMGVLNYNDFNISGEEFFLSSVVASKKKGEITVFDVGANSGSYSTRIRSIWPGSIVYAFEPHPNTYQELQGVAMRGGFHAVNVACGESAGELEFFDKSQSDGSSHASMYRGVIEGLFESPSIKRIVKVTTLDDFAAENNINRIDLLKIDTEGHEFKVLLGAQKLLSEGKIDILQIEFNEMNVYSRTFFLDFWNLLNDYHFFRLAPDGMIPITRYVPIECEIFAFQNLVAIRKQMATRF